ADPGRADLHAHRRVLERLRLRWDRRGSARPKLAARRPARRAGIRDLQTGRGTARGETRDRFGARARHPGPRGPRDRRGGLSRRPAALDARRPGSRAAEADAGAGGGGGVRPVTAPFDTEWLFASILLATPILYAAGGELISQRAGVMNIGLEGM